MISKKYLTGSSGKIRWRRSGSPKSYERCGTLTQFPDRGRSGRINGTRELVFAPLPYIAVYRVRSDVVEIVRVHHSAQDWP